MLWQRFWKRYWYRGPEKQRSEGEAQGSNLALQSGVPCEKNESRGKMTPKTFETNDLSNDLTTDDLKFLDEAAAFFEDPGRVAKGLAWAGKPIEVMHDRLPEKAKTAIAIVTEAAIKKAFLAAVRTIPEKPDSEEPVGREQKEAESLLSKRTHTGLATLTGVLGGLVGLPALAIELPITTVLILRAISDQARLYGHDLNDLETRLECLMVFTMGVPDNNADESAPGSKAAGAERKPVANYFMTRASFVSVMKRTAATAGAFSAKELLSSVEKGSAPIIVRMISSVAEKFQVRVSQKFLAESVPLLGALGGGALNYAFTDFFVTAARFHFRIRALEKKFGEEIIQEYLKKGVANAVV